MPHEETTTKAWLVLRSGPLAGKRYLLRDGVTRLGRSPENDIVIQGPECAVVSLLHLEISREGKCFRVRDLGSTNGTFLNGERVEDAEAHPPATIRLGNQGPEFSLQETDASAAELDRTLVVPEGVVLPQTPAASPLSSGDYDKLLSQAVTRARQARIAGPGNQTVTIMREVLERAMRRTSRRFRAVIAVLAVLLLVVSGVAYWKITDLKRDKGSIDHRIRELESRLEKSNGTPEQLDPLISELTTYQNQAVQLERNPLYRFGVREKEGFLLGEIRTLMAEFGAEVYSIPPEFAERVQHYMDQFQGPNRPILQRAFGKSREQLRIMRQVLEQQSLPPDLAYMVLVESALESNQASSAGAAGLWQFTPATAKAYGLHVDKTVDERLDIRKATLAGCRYLRDLILDFGAGSSVMLALAAYNLGPQRVKQAVTRTVRDPIKQRNFWYLYRVRALPHETREYVPKVMSAMILGRNAARFGL